MYSNIIIQKIRINRPVYSLTQMFESGLTDSSKKVAGRLMRTGIKPLNNQSTRTVFCAPYTEDESSAFGDTDIVLSFFAHIMQKPELFAEFFEGDDSMILDRNVLSLNPREDVHVGIDRDGNLKLVPRLQPEDLSKYRFVKVALT